MNFEAVYRFLDGAIFLGWWYVPLYLLGLVLLWRGNGSPEYSRRLVFTGHFYVYLLLPLAALAHAVIGVFFLREGVTSSPGLHGAGSGFLVWFGVAAAYIMMDVFFDKHFGVGFMATRVNGRRVPGIKRDPEVYGRTARRVKRDKEALYHEYSVGDLENMSASGDPDALVIDTVSPNAASGRR
jgi:hypothetical protein